ncbi:hypothetical protein FC99_GL002603 [Levilactobacillus koreensis JCM 16448]|uniref:Uncharacterized protein n=1 Tax=Levilactobacillus koreensis TaxID=637971 RepID=A0AAC8ZGN6_9LACO|nr:hypothetical protein [Levilactobacillus koreensis]AKP64662.1 hypothetical protein ABN16_06410 [Levilactobacillus koreensis]KRK90796.1 hypothetical protein FC99_GL002603 [Levilactobacillus koreensis JCM 16448]
MNTDLNLIFKNLGIVGIDLLVIPFVFVTLLTYLNRDTKKFLANGFGINSELYLGFIGIFFHELSHLLTAVLFGHRIDKVRLVKRPHPNRRGADGQPDLALGYVNHTWNQRNWYQVIGNLFIGVAPIFGCALVLLVLTATLIPSLFQGMLTLIANPFSLDWSGFFQNIGGDNHPVIRWTVMILLSLNISIGGFDLSTADFANSRIGLIGFVVIITAITVLLTMGNLASGFLKFITAAIILLAVVLSYALLVSLLTNLLVRLGLQIKEH